ncbi:MAG: hypothetical protein RLP44_23680 [Aggregatilineales bacterium]
MRRICYFGIVMIVLISQVAIAQTGDSLQGEEFILRRQVDGSNEHLVLWLNSGTGEITEVHRTFIYPSSRSEPQALHWSPDGDIFYYVSDGEIFSKSGQNATPVNLSHTPDVIEESIFVSPDGAHITFFAYSEQERYLNVMNSDGTNKQRILDVIFPQIFVAWSPDSSRFAFANDFDGVYVTDVDDVNTRNVYNEISTGIFSPDGRYLLVSSLESLGQLVHIDLQTGVMRVLLDSISQPYRFPVPSPTVEWIAVLNFINSRQPDLNMVNANSGEVRIAAESLFSNSTTLWSPDGENVLFIGESADNGVLDAWVYAVASDEATMITRDLRLLNPEAELDTDSFIWSPDGTKLAFHTVQDNRAQLYFVDADGENLTTLNYGDAQFDDRIISWRP